MLDENQLFEAILNQTLTDSGPVCLFTSLRLSRNLDGERFVWRSDIAARRRLRQHLIEVLPQHLTQVNCFPYEELTNDETAFLIEQNPAELIRTDQSGGAFVTSDGGFRFFINDVDHLRIIKRTPYRSLQTAFEQLRTLDGALDKDLVWACDQRFGFLGPATDDFGARLKINAVVFLPGIAASAVLDRVAEGLIDAGLELRPLYNNEHTADLSNDELWSPFFLITAVSRSPSSEIELLAQSTAAFDELIDGELETRRRLLDNRRAYWIDRFRRAVALLRTAYLLPENEARSLLADLRFALTANQLATMEAGLVPMDAAGSTVPIIDRLAAGISKASLRLAEQSLAKTIGLSSGESKDHSAAEKAPPSDVLGDSYYDWLRAALARERLPHYHIV